ncbi:hypothetical protein LA080_001248 [Diaporthe eres]|nr:hypothetical protein LA080_001248 [Diaporthe eres]
MVSLALRRIQQGLTTTFNGLSNPWTHPMWFYEDVSNAIVLFLEDYVFCSPVFWLLFYIFIIYCAIQTPLYLRHEYLHFLSLGRGARPSTVRGWLQNKLYQFLLTRIIGVEVLSTPFRDPLMEPYNGVLCRYVIPERVGPRPEIIGMDPMRQRTDVNPGVVQWIRDWFVTLAFSNPEAFRIQNSYLTGLPAVVRNLPGAPPNGTPNTVTEWGGEVAHVRHDGSTTFCLHPHDVQEVIRLGWGQRNPLAVMNEVWLWRFIHHRILWTGTPLSHNMVTVYAPRDEDEKLVFIYILAAAVFWADYQSAQ